jgi:hypothetical protein
MTVMKQLSPMVLAVILAMTAPVCSPMAAEPSSENPAKAVNTICPVTGKAVDAKLSPVVVVIGKGDKAKRVVIGIAEASAGDTIKADPQRYAAAAKANKKAE